MTEVFFWSDSIKPADYVNPSVSADRRLALVGILQAGEISMQYRGPAACRICRKLLGSCDMTGFGFKWPQRAEHYVIEHQVWPPGADELLAAGGG